MKKISITLLLCLLCLTGMAQGQKALDLKDITSGRFRPENIQGVIPMPDGEDYTQMNAGGTQIIAHESVRILHEGGVPRGALQFTPGSGRLGAGMMTAPERHSSPLGMMLLPGGMLSVTRIWFP